MFMMQEWHYFVTAINQEPTTNSPKTLQTSYIIKLVYEILVNKMSNRPDPGEWGWEWNADSQCWLPLWTTLPIASKACLELIKCSC